MSSKAANKEAVVVPGIPDPPFRYSHAIRSGDFVFPSGLIASDFEDGVAPGTGVDPALPYHTRRVVPQTEWIFDRLGQVLDAAGTSLEGIVRIDQFFAKRDDKPGYFPVKNAVLTGDRPASCALEMSGLLLPDAGVMVDTYAIVPRDGFAKIGHNTKKAAKIVAGHSMAVGAGDWIWTSGATPSDLQVDAPYPWGTDGTAGLADEARYNPNYNYDYPMPKQLHFVFKKMAAYLEAAGSDLSRVVKAQAYLTDMADFHDFNAIWKDYFPHNPPATLIAPLTRTGMTGGRLEVSLVALRSDSSIEVEGVTPASGTQTLGHFPDAVRVGSLLFLSGQTATNKQGYDQRARPNPRQPSLTSKAKLQTRVILDNIAKICEAAGGSVDSVVKAVFFFSSNEDILPTMEEWGRAFGDPPPAVSIVLSEASHIVPESSITVDVYATL